MNFLDHIPTILPLLLFLIMLFMGMTLSVADFRRVAIYPKAVVIGLLCQLVLLPIIAFGIIKILPLEAVFAMGIMIVAASPGGAVSNLISHLSKADTALSISLTAVSSVLTLFTIPLILNFSLLHLMDSGSVVIELPYGKTVFNIFKLTILPVAIGMSVNHYFPKLTKTFLKAITWISVLIIILALILVYVKLDQIGDVPTYIRKCFLAVLILNMATLGVGYFGARFSGINRRQAITISIETGMQNNVLGMAIATAPSLLNNPLMAVPAGVYGLLMCTTAVIMILIFRKLIDAQNNV